MCYRSEFVSKEFDPCAFMRGVTLHFSRSGKREAWRKDHNSARPHSALVNQVPAALHRSGGNPGQPTAQRPADSGPEWSNVGGKSSPSGATFGPGQKPGGRSPSQFRGSQ
jgi:hypothetical protein